MEHQAGRFQGLAQIEEELIEPPHSPTYIFLSLELILESFNTEIKCSQCHYQESQGEVWMVWRCFDIPQNYTKKRHRLFATRFERKRE